MEEKTCPQGGSHEFKPNWEWDRHRDQYEFYDLICTKCGELEGETK